MPTYEPAYAIKEMDKYTNKIVAIQGPPGSGKTASALTFPNPIFALLEKPDLQGLLQLPHLAGVKPLLLPFYEPKFVNEVLKFPKSGQLTDSAGAFKQWVETEATKLTQEQTLVIDNWTRLQEHFDKINWGAPLYPTYNKRGEIDDFAPWDRKIDYAEKVSNSLVALSCNVVVLYHEIQERDKATGALLDKTQPLMQGKFIAKLKSYFPNFYRQHCKMPRDAAGKIIEGKDAEYLWQVKSSNDFDAKCSIPSLPAFVPANYTSLVGGNKS